MGWIIHLVVYYLGVIWTFVVFALTNPEGEKGADGAMVALFAVLWPLTWVITGIAWIGYLVKSKRKF